MKKKAPKTGQNREFYPGTVALIQKWFLGGDTVEEIAKDTGRSCKQVMEALGTPLTSEERKNICSGLPYVSRRISLKELH